MGKDKFILVRVTEKERDELKKKASRKAMTVSEYIREALIHSDDLTISVIDIRPLKKVIYELSKQGSNLNQFVRVLNTYGIRDYNESLAREILEREGMLFLKVVDALAQLRQEAERHHVNLIETEIESSGQK